MKHIHLQIALAALFICGAAHGQTTSRAADSTAFVNAEWNWKDLGKGAMAGSAHISMFGGDQTVSIVKYPARKFRTSIEESAGDLCVTTDSLAKRTEALAAINGSYFNVKTLQPCTFFALAHNEISRTAQSEFFRTNALVAFKNKKGRKMDIMLCDTTRYEYYTKRYHAALASGPLLIQDGKIPAFATDRRFSNARHPRTLIGKDSRGNYYFVTIDGRAKNHADGATLTESALIALWAGMDNAINLDGGGSTTIWTSEDGVLNHPTDNKKFDHAGTRRVPNIIIMK